MKSIAELAREAGLYTHKEVQPELQRFAALVIEQAHKRLLAGSGEPEGSAEVFAGMNEYGLPEYTNVDAYTADQMAAAVLRYKADAERLDWLDKCAHVAGWVEHEPTKMVIDAASGEEFTGDTWREAIDEAIRRGSDD